jgi:ABC-type uncharacterized transport system ATPase subunit
MNATPILHVDMNAFYAACHQAQNVSLKGHPIIVSAQATRGLDIGAVEGVHELLRGLRKQGAAVLYISTELNEILTLCDRIVVLFNGEIMGEVAPDKEKIGEIGQMMMGQRKGVL